MMNRAILAAVMAALATPVAAQDPAPAEPETPIVQESDQPAADAATATDDTMGTTDTEASEPDGDTAADTDTAGVGTDEADAADAADEADASGEGAEVPEADLAAGEELYKKSCRSCHGPKARGMASFPRLSDKDADYLLERLTQYKAGEKVGPNSALMYPIAEKLSEDDMRNVATYIATTFD